MMTKDSSPKVQGRSGTSVSLFGQCGRASFVPVERENPGGSDGVLRRPSDEICVGGHWGTPDHRRRGPHPHKPTNWG